MKSMNKSIIVLFSILLLSVSSCNLDINVDPNSPATVPNAQLLSSAEVAIFTSFGHNGSGLGQTASIWVHQVMIRSNADGYGSTGTDANINNPWLNLYSGALQDLETIIKQATTNGEFRYLGIAKLLKAYSYNMMVDVWGDIPYSEAQGGAVQPFPKFDDDATIYPKLFTLIDEAIADLGKTQGALASNPGNDDLVYGGSATNWVRFAKALKLKMYNTVKGVQTVTTELTALMADPDIAAFSADFELKYFNVAAPENRNPAWISVSGAGTYMSRYFYEILNGRSTLNPILGSIVDPRLPYYLYNSLGTSNPNAQNPTEYRDQPYATLPSPAPADQRFFVGINFSSQSPNQGFDQSRSLSMPGVYFCGNKLDIAQVGGGILIASAPGNVPTRLFPKYMLTYIRSEVALFLDPTDAAGTARSLLRTAIEESIDKVNTVTTGVFSTAPTISVTNRNAYRDAVSLIWDAATSAGKLELTMTEKWIANFGNSLESYTDFRRTGYPVMFDPNNDGDTYRQLDIQLNKNAPAQKLISDVSAKVFWDN
jgi:hypothetical protein